MATQILPKQKLPRSQKDTAWGKAMMDDLDKLAEMTENSNRSSKYKKQVNYDLYNGKLNQSDFEYVLNPYGFKNKDFPANLQHYDLISPKINLLLGEEIKRPFNFNVTAIDPESISEVTEAKQKAIYDSIVQMMEQKYEEQQQEEQKMQAMQQGQPVPQQQQKPKPKSLQDVEKYFNTTYKSLREITGQNIISYLMEKDRCRLKFNEMFKDALISGEEIAYVGSRGGDPTVRVCNTKDITVITDPDSPWIEDAIAVLEERWLAPTTILDEFYDELTPKQIDEIETTNGRMGNDSINYPESTFMIKGPEEYANAQNISNTRDVEGTIRVLHAEWRSMRLVYIIEAANGESDVFGEEFKIPEEAIKVEDYWTWTIGDIEVKCRKYWISEVWEGTKIGHNIYVDIKPKANQRRSMDNPSRCKLGYVGYIFNNKNSESVSLLDRMKPYQYFYNIIFYRTEKAFALNKGRWMLMDLAQIPTSMGFDVEQWLYYAEAMGVAFVNSAEENSKGEKSSFNQFQSIDLSMGNYINQHIQTLDKIEDKLGELSGVSKQRMGQISSGELVGNSERAVVQSSHITETWFYFHDEVKQRVLTALLEVAQMVWKGNKKLNFILDDMTRSVVNLEDSEFAATEYAVFVRNSSQDLELKNLIKQMAVEGYRSGNIPSSDAITMLQHSSIAKMKQELEIAEQTRQQQTQQAQQAEQEAIAKEKEQETQLTLKLDQSETERNMLDNATKVKVAEIMAKSKMDAQPQPDHMKMNQEREKLNLLNKKIQSDHMNKQQKLQADKAAKEKDQKLKEQELAIKEKQANKPNPSK